MAQDGSKRKLAAILSADVKGYSILLADDESFTIKTLKEYREIMSNCIEQHNGRVVDSPGDNLLSEFSSAVDAVDCAVQIQNRLKKENAKFVEDKRLEFRIGVNIGDVVHDGDRIYGEGVNIAARIEGLTDAGGVCISRNTYDQIKNKLTYEYEYLGEYDVKNINELVRVYKVMMGTGTPKLLVKEPLELPDKPSIAVLPFTNMSGDPSQEYFSDGLTEQIINGLCNIPNLFVIARNSSFAYRDKLVSIKQIARELGVKYILEGSIQRAGERVRITAQLIDATTDFHMWSKSFDRELSDVFTLQDEITIQLVVTMAEKLIPGQQVHSFEAGTANIHAFDSCLKGMYYLHKFSKGDNAHARSLFEDAINYDKTYALPYVMMGFSHMVDLALGFRKSQLHSFQQAEKYVEKALVLNDSLDLAHALLGFIHLYKRQYKNAKEEGERAIELNPNGADVHVFLAFSLRYMEETKKAIRLFKRAFRLNPVPPAIYYTWLGETYEADGQYEMAIEVCKKAIEINYHLYGSYCPLISSCMRLKMIDEAQKYSKELLHIAPKFSLKLFRSIEPYKNQEKADEYIEILRKAGLPD